MSMHFFRSLDQILCDVEKKKDRAQREYNMYLLMCDHVRAFGVAVPLEALLPAQDGDVFKQFEQVKRTYPGKRRFSLKERSQLRSMLRYYDLKLDYLACKAIESRGIIHEAWQAADLPSEEDLI